jgi:hypothetical protein
MDFVGETIIKTSYAVDEDTGILTITFKDHADVVIDTLVIENIKYKSLIKALGIIADERITSLMTQVGHRTTYLALTNAAETVFI